MAQKWLVVVGLLGIIVAFVGQLLIGGSPGDDGSPAAVRSWFMDHRALALTAAYMAAFGLTLHLLLIGALRDRLRGATGTALSLADLVLPATILWLGSVMIGIGSLTVLAYRADGMSDEAARLLNDGGYLAFGAAGFGTALALGCVAVVVLRTKILPSWFGWTSAAVGTLHLVAAAAFAESGAATPRNGSLVAILYYLWVCAAAVVLWRAHDADRSPAAARIVSDERVV